AKVISVEVDFLLPVKSGRIGNGTFGHGDSLRASKRILQIGHSFYGTSPRTEQQQVESRIFRQVQCRVLLTGEGIDVERVIHTRCLTKGVAGCKQLVATFRCLSVT